MAVKVTGTVIDSIEIFLVFIFEIFLVFIYPTLTLSRNFRTRIIIYSTYVALW
jgi:hypothetical protein